MATRTAGLSKSDFIRDILRKNPTANQKAVEKAWHEAGREGPIQSSLVSTLRRKLGLMDHTRVGSGPPEGNGTAELPKARAKATRPKKRGRRRNGKVSGADATHSCQSHALTIIPSVGHRCSPDHSWNRLDPTRWTTSRISGWSPGSRRRRRENRIVPASRSTSARTSRLAQR